MILSYDEKMKSQKHITIAAMIWILALAGIILTDLYYPFTHSFQSHFLIGVTAIAATFITSRVLKISLSDDVRPISLGILIYLLVISLNVFLSGDETSMVITDITSKEIDTSRLNRRRSIHYFATVRLPGAVFPSMNETARLRINSASFSYLDTKKFQARVTVKQGFFRLPYIVSFKFHSKK